LRFYDASDQRLTVFQEIKKVADRLVFTSQSQPEFERNRTATLRRVIQEFKKRQPSTEYGTTVLHAMPSFASVASAKSDLTRAMNTVLAELEKAIASPETDPVLSAFLELTADPRARTIQITDDVVRAAQRRKLLGNPPTSSDMHSIGDEAHWEALLGELKGDLVVVTNDSTYLDNVRLLREEFARRTNANLSVVSRLSEGLREIGKEPPQPIVEAEKKLDEGRPLAPPGWDIASVSGFMATVRRPEDGRVGGVPTVNHPQLESYRCPNCGSFGPWNGATCLTCGQRSFDD
jgi:hypothetical protein